MKRLEGRNDLWGRPSPIDICGKRILQLSCGLGRGGKTAATVTLIPVRQPMISTLLESLKKWRNRCRSCDVGGIHKSLLHNFQNISEIARYKTVLEYQCTQCGTVWLRPDHSDFLVKVFKNELYTQWKQRSWLPTDTQIDALNLIGGVFAHDTREVFFPCEVRLPNGSRVQRAVLTATTGRCFGQFPFSRNFALLSEDFELSPSRDALPAAVRAVTLTAPEKRMGYAPVNVKDARGNRYTLSGPMHFFKKNDVPGSEILLDDSPYHGRNVVYPFQVEMYVICDLFDPRTNGCAESSP